ncbi:MAG: ATPase, T2SS/T4P/T4SS family, partial [Terriglobia bacterium]
MDSPLPAEFSEDSGTTLGASTAVETFLVPLRRLLAGNVTEVVINRPGEAWTEDREGWRRHAIPALTYEHLRTFATLIANSTQQTIQESAPLVSASLPTGERVQAVVPPAVPARTVSLTI